MQRILSLFGIWISLSLLMTIYWIVGLMLAGLLIPGSMPQASDTDSSAMMLLVICMLNTAVLLFYLYNSHVRSWKLVIYVFLISFGLQYFLTQIETFWFNDALKMSQALIWMVVLGGVLSTLAFSITVTRMTGRFKKPSNVEVNLTSEKRSLIKWIFFHSIITWPAIYFIAGYFIAWQFAEVRLFYSGKEEMDAFVTIMKGNFKSGLYFFQIFRGLVWIAIGFLVLSSVEKTRLKKALILGLLFSVLSSSQLLLPNPIMSDAVRTAHLIETCISNFLWGFIVAVTLNQFVKFTRIQS